jgi:WD40 repeat protein
VAYTNGTINIWKKDNWQLLKNIDVGFIISSFHVDDQYMYVGSENGELKILNQDGREIYYTMIRPKQPLSAITSDKSYLFIGSYDTTIRILNKSNWKVIKIIENHTFAVNDLIVDDECLYSASSDATIKIFKKQNWDLKNILGIKENIGNKRYGFLKIVTWENKIFAGSMAGEISIWNKTSGTLLRILKVCECDMKALDTDDKYLYSGLNDGFIKIWTREGNLANEIKASSGVTALAVDEDFIYAGIYNSTIEVWDKNTYKLNATLGEYLPYEEIIIEVNEEPENIVISPSHLFLIFVGILLTILIIMEINQKIKKSKEKSVARKIAHVIQSHVKIEDILLIDILSTSIISLLIFLRKEFLLPLFSSSLHPIYYFDAFVRNGPFKLIWFITWPAVGYWLGKKKFSIKISYLIALIFTIISIFIYIFAPKIIL